jgi:hypothetical protein
MGDIVVLKLGMLGNATGAHGVVYEEYNFGDGPGVGVIFSNGNYDGFSTDEQDEFLERVGHSDVLAEYQFTNVTVLSRHFDCGVFDALRGMDGK